MNDLISRQAAIEAIAVTLKYEDYGFLSDELESVINNVPAADVVEIIRCKDCRYLYEDNKCPLRTWWTHTEDDYCSYAERRTDERLD